MTSRKLARIGHGTFRLAERFKSMDKVGNVEYNPLLRSIRTNLVQFIDTAPNYGDGSAVRIFNFFPLWLVDLVWKA